MGTLLLELTPFAIGLAVSPATIAVTIMFLTSDRPVGNALAFAGGFGAVYAALSVIVLVVVGAASEPLISQTAKAVITIAVGLLLLALGIKSGRSPQSNTGLLSRAEHTSPRKAFTLGLVVAVVNWNVPLYLGGLATITASGADVGATIAGALLLLLGAEAGLLVPVLWYVLWPRGASRGLARVKTWFGRHEKKVVFGVLVVFGVVFVVKGIAGL
ncbi:hypothetical protein BLA60_23455 [Actinophytocola xinjiangensis]|uniref:Sap-like sulfolipid-1-addressing protein n=1 Tax=Actinophytocola xinjiangensis TaxID=485602 RepID=A0A7Z1AXJ3_9PSEU|nr:GAP family protein [Actinophytocola xinjiangensis]OLF08377.1 hypothetical protein BLA60_23455 [Actinophytocola xinjiangensis]